MKKLLSICALAVLVFTMVSCSNDSGLVGKWKLLPTGSISIDSTLEFTDDKNGKVSLGESISANFTYTYEGNTLTLKTSLLGQENKETYTVISLNSDKLVVKQEGQDQEVTYERQ